MTSQDVTHLITLKRTSSKSYIDSIGDSLYRYAIFVEGFVMLKGLYFFSRLFVLLGVVGMVLTVVYSVTGNPNLHFFNGRVSLIAFFMSQGALLHVMRENAILRGQR